MSDEWPCYCAHMEGECEPCIMEREARAFVAAERRLAELGAMYVGAA